jgi:8-oxo-dGTP pyrophosphatase MutT (NUDIX family)
MSTTTITVPTAPATVPTRHRRKCFGGILSATPTTSETHYLLVKGRHGGIWSFPKGHSKKGEEPLVTARREIEEETGLTFPDQEPRHIQRLKGALYFHFVCHPHLITTTPQPHDTREIEEVRWMTLEDMSTLLLVNSGIRDFLKKRQP